MNQFRMRMIAVFILILMMSFQNLSFSENTITLTKPPKVDYAYGIITLYTSSPCTVNYEFYRGDYHTYKNRYKVDTVKTEGLDNKVIIDIKELEVGNHSVKILLTSEEQTQKPIPYSVGLEISRLYSEAPQLSERWFIESRERETVYFNQWEAYMGNGVDVKVVIDKPGKFYYIVQPSNLPEPDVDQMINKGTLDLSTLKEMVYYTKVRHLKFATRYRAYFFFTSPDGQYKSQVYKTNTFYIPRRTSFYGVTKEVYPELKGKDYAEAANFFAKMYYFRPTGKFDPEKPVTRYEAAQLASGCFQYVFESDPQKVKWAKKVKINDVITKKNESYAVEAHVRSALEKGIFQLYPDGTFRLNELITRKEMYRVLQAASKTKVEMPKDGKSETSLITRAEFVKIFFDTWINKL